MNKICDSSSGNKDVLVSLSLDRCADFHQKVILIPDGDDEVVTIDKNKDRLKEYFLFSHIAKEPCLMECRIEKTHQKRLAKELDLNVTNANIVEIRDGQYTYPIYNILFSQNLRLP